MTQKLGIIGDGQLARYLCREAKELRLESYVLGKESSPAHAEGATMIDNIEELVAECDVVTFENEFFDFADVAATVSQKPELRFFPQLDVVKHLRQKAKQKVLLNTLEIPTPAFRLLMDESPEDYLNRLEEDVQGPFVLKWSLGGYDSKGTFFYRSKFDRSAAVEFIAEAKKASSDVYAEDLVPFQRELAIVGARDQKGNIRSMPLVETLQEEGICKKATGPVLSEELCEKAESILRLLLLHLDYVGVLAVEFFETSEGELLVNELAPRVHNSGHFSLFSATISQFRWHVEALCGAKLSESKLDSHFAMWNLIPGEDLGPVDSSIVMEMEKDLDAMIGLFWYDKTEARQKRKMGHLCTSASDETQLQTRIELMQKWENTLWKKLAMST